jgi:hypothetical protein
VGWLVRVRYGGSGSPGRPGAREHLDSERDRAQPAYREEAPAGASARPLAELLGEEQPDPDPERDPGSGDQRYVRQFQARLFHGSS